MKNCPICNGLVWNSFFNTSTGRIMTGDQRIGNGNLEKIICAQCGVVSNKKTFTDDEIELLYGKEYELNTFEREEHLFFTPNGPIPRSQVFADWLIPHFPKQFETLTEIGCGEGLLLEKIKKIFPNKNLLGFDGSIKATELGRKKGLNIKQKLFLPNDNKLLESDVILLINVIEHIEDICGMIRSISTSLKKGGRIIFCLPIQDYGGYDLFFAEHVWHFTTRHINHLLKNLNLNVIHQDSNHSINHGIGLFICEHNGKTNNDFPKEHTILENTFAYWKNNFDSINEQINKEKFKRIAVFGSGEVLTLFFTFTSLGSQNIVACIDETPSKIGTLKHGIPISNIDWFEKNSADAVFLTVNKKYHQMIKNKLAKYHLNIFSII
ncbi:MAG: class I SAM-dependent methyltransferase [Bacteroidota bacterium]